VNSDQSPASMIGFRDVDPGHVHLEFDWRLVQVRNENATTWIACVKDTYRWIV